LRDGATKVGFVDAEVAFREDDNLVAWDVELFESFANDSLRSAVGVDVGLNYMTLSITSTEYFENCKP
jgi:hypothetical protein